MSNKRIFENNAKTVLASPLLIDSTSILVSDGSKFPTPTDGDYFMATIDAGSSKEVVKVYGRVGNVFSGVIRGQEDTAPATFALGTKIENRITRDTAASWARYEDRLADVPSVDNIPAPLTVDGNSYLTLSVDDGGNSIAALKAADRWSFLTHGIVSGNGTVTTDSGQNNIISSDIGAKMPNFLTGKFIVQFKSGPNAGLCRLVTSVTDSVAGWITPLPSANLAGVQFDILQSTYSAVIAAGLSQSEAYEKVRRPINSYPLTGGVNVGTRVTLTTAPYRSLYDVPHAASQFQVSASADFSTGLVLDSGTLVAAVTQWEVTTTLAANTVYYWRARFRDEEGVWSSFSAATSFRTGFGVMSTPAIASPTNGATAVSALPTITASAFSVGAGTDVHVYSDWQVWTGPNGTGVKAFESLGDNINKTSITLSTALAATTGYYARVRYRGLDYGTSAWSTDVSFTTGALVNRPTITSPTNAATGLSSFATITSSAFLVTGGSDTHASSDWQIWTGPNATGVKVYESLANTSAKTTITLPNSTLPPSTVYYPRVRHRGTALGVSAWSPLTSFTTANPMEKAANLSDVSDAAASRNNLSVPSKAELKISAPPGEIVMFAGPNGENGYFWCNGAAVSRTVYVELFNKIGTYYGAGDGFSTFNIPDLRGVFMRGWDGGRGVDPGRAFGSFQWDEIRYHTHTYVHNRGGGGLYSNQGNNWDAAEAQTSAVGGNETRPINVAVQFNIRY